MHYGVNKKPRKANGRYDFIYSAGKGTGRVEFFNSTMHGNWEITLDDNGKLIVVQTDDESTDADEYIDQGETVQFSLALDFITRPNLMFK